jgi:hypothetical protein
MVLAGSNKDIRFNRKVEVPKYQGGGVIYFVRPPDNSGTSAMEASSSLLR